MTYTAMGVAEGGAARPQTVTAVITSVMGACTPASRGGHRALLMLSSGNIDITGNNIIALDGWMDGWTDGQTNRHKVYHIFLKY